MSSQAEEGTRELSVTVCGEEATAGHSEKVAICKPGRGHGRTG